MPRIKKATDANGNVFYPITIVKGVYDTERNQSLSQTLLGIPNVPAWALAANKPSYSYNEINSAPSNQSAQENGTTVSLVTTGEKFVWNNKANNTLFSNSANGLAPAASSANKTTAETGVGNYYLCADGKYRPLPSTAFSGATYENKQAASGGTDVSLCTTGEKYTWNNKANNTLFSDSANGLAPSIASGNQADAETSQSVRYLCSDGKWRPLPSGAWATGTSTLELGISSSTAYRGDYGNSAYSEAVTFGTGVTTDTSVASVAVTKKNVIVTIANGQTSQTFSLASAPTAGREIHIIVDNRNNSSDLSIGIPHGTVNNRTYVNTNDCEAGSMTVSAGKIGEINVIYASSKVWIKYIGG